MQYIFKSTPLIHKYTVNKHIATSTIKVNDNYSCILHQVQSSPRLAILLRSPKVAWHRVQWSGAERPARFLTKWELSSYKAELIPSPSNSIFGKVSAPEVSMVSRRSHTKTGLDSAEDVQLEDPTVRSSDDLIIEEGEECKVQ